jgi:very-short-patch-repair endonuclease
MSSIPHSPATGETTGAGVVASVDELIEWEFVRHCESPMEKLFLRACYEYLAPGEAFSRLFPQVQLDVPPYRLDFAWCNDCDEDPACGGLAVEIDGHDFHKSKAQRTADARRDRYLELRGWHVMRFTGSEVFANADKCAREVHEWLSANYKPWRDG